MRITVSPGTTVSSRVIPMASRPMGSAPNLMRDWPVTNSAGILKDVVVLAVERPSRCRVSFRIT